MVTNGFENTHMLDYRGKTILITGGTGSLGSALTRYILKEHPDIKQIRVVSRDEQKQAQMARELPLSHFPQLQFVIGDVRDKARLIRVFDGVDYVIHTAAMKDVHIAERNPDECIKTNIGGAQNVIEASMEAGVARVVALSTDKACAPNSLYGATKLVSDKLFISANTTRNETGTTFSVVRYGNMMGSSGSVVPFFLKKKREDGVLPITDSRMTRFNITIPYGVKMVLLALETSWGGEVFVPKLPSYRIMDVANAIGPDCEKPIVGIRPGEKLHEEMISPSDAFYTYDLGTYYVILPSSPPWPVDDFITAFKAKKVPPGFSYNSGENTAWETVDSLKGLIKAIKKD